MSFIVLLHGTFYWIKRKRTKNQNFSCTHIEQTNRQTARRMEPFVNSESKKHMFVFFLSSINAIKPAFKSKHFFVFLSLFQFCLNKNSCLITTIKVNAFFKQYFLFSVCVCSICSSSISQQKKSITTTTIVMNFFFAHSIFPRRLFISKNHCRLADNDNYKSLSIIQKRAWIGIVCVSVRTAPFTLAMGKKPTWKKPLHSGSDANRRTTHLWFGIVKPDRHTTNTKTMNNNKINR